MKHIELTIDQYFSEPASRRFISHEGNRTLEALFIFLQEEVQVVMMINNTKIKRPAMECLIETIEDQFLDFQSYDLQRIMAHRQITGSMIRFILGHYGLRPGKAKPLKKGRYIRTAIVFYN